MITAALAFALFAADHHDEAGHEQHPGVVAGLEALAAGVSEERLRSDVDTLVGFGTRHTLSSQSDPERGIGAAWAWSEAQFEALGLETVRVCDEVTGRRIPEPVRVCNVVAIQRGTERPEQMILLTGHIDSRVSDVMDAVSDAPGANDDGSGTAGVLEAARVLSRHEFPATIVYAHLTGEEQGLFGGRILAAHARENGWQVIANLNNDIIGNSCGSDGHCEPDVVRLFSEGPRRQGYDAALMAAQHRLGGENDAPSRGLSRYVDALAEQLPGIGLDVRPIWRTDRWGRGGDHIEMLGAGYPAVRFTVGVEDYDHQHQDLRTRDGTFYGDVAAEMDFAYLARVTALNVATAAALASAPPPPVITSTNGAVSTFTRIEFDESEGAYSYRVYWRRTDASQWQHHVEFPRYGRQDDRVEAVCLQLRGDGTPPPSEQREDFGCKVKLPGMRVDDWIFGVSAIAADGAESPVVAAVPGGNFAPIEDSAGQ